MYDDRNTCGKSADVHVFEMWVKRFQLGPLLRAEKTFPNKATLCFRAPNRTLKTSEL